MTAKRDLQQKSPYASSANLPQLQGHVEGKVNNPPAWTSLHCCEHRNTTPLRTAQLKALKIKKKAIKRIGKRSVQVLKAATIQRLGESGLLEVAGPRVSSTNSLEHLEGRRFVMSLYLLPFGIMVIRKCFEISTSEKLLLNQVFAYWCLLS